MIQLARHKRIVTTFKILVIICICAILSLVYGWSQSANDKALPSSANSTDEQKPQEYEANMRNFTFYGTSQSMRPYKIMADSATKITESEYQLESVSAEYNLSESNLLVKSQNATIMQDKFIALSNNVQIHLNEIECNSSAMTINLINNNIATDHTVFINYHNSQIIADNLQADTNSNIVKLHGNVKTKIDISSF